ASDGRLVVRHLGQPGGAAGADLLVRAIEQPGLGRGWILRARRQPGQPRGRFHVMTIWQTSLLDPIYASPIAVNATIVRTTGERHTIRAIDETEGVSLPGPGALVEMQTQRPAAVCRLGELNAKGITDLKEFFWQGK